MSSRGLKQLEINDTKTLQKILTLQLFIIVSYAGIFLTAELLSKVITLPFITISKSKEYDVLTITTNPYKR